MIGNCEDTNDSSLWSERWENLHH